MSEYVLFIIAVLMIQLPSNISFNRKYPLIYSVMNKSKIYFRIHYSKLRGKTVVIYVVIVVADGN